MAVGMRCRLRVQRAQAVFGEGAGGLSAGHETRQEDVRRRPHDAGDCTELARADRRLHVRRTDRSCLLYTSEAADE